jgi:hypothetical protein
VGVAPQLHPLEAVDVGEGLLEQLGPYVRVYDGPAVTARLFVSTTDDRSAVPVYLWS